MKYLISGIFIMAASMAFGQEIIKVIPSNQTIFQSFTNVRDFTISNSGDEAYFSGQSPLGELSVIFRTNKKPEKWAEPVVAPFSGKYHDLEPFLSTDGLRLYFASNRPLSDTSKIAKDYDIWMVKRNSKKETWSEPVNLGFPVNTEYNEFYPSVADNRNLYFTSDQPDTKGNDDIFFSRWDGKVYLAPITLNDSINSEGFEFNAFISPDESYIIFSGYRREDGLGSGDLYISKNVNGQWQMAVNLGEGLNSQHMDYCPFVQNNLLYFTSKRSSVGINEKPFNSLSEFLDEINQYENGTSRIYEAYISHILNEK